MGSTPGSVGQKGVAFFPWRGATTPTTRNPPKRRAPAAHGVWAPPPTVFFVFDTPKQRGYGRSKHRFPKTTPFCPQLDGVDPHL